MLKMKSLQSNYIELTEREKRLSDAKIQLSATRMELQRLKHQIRQSKCSLCRIGAQNQDMAEHGGILDDTALNEHLPTQMNARTSVNMHADINSIDDIVLMDCVSRLDDNQLPTSSMKHYSLAGYSNLEHSIDSDALLLNLNLRALDEIDRL